MKTRPSSKNQGEYVLCVKNRGHAASLELRKIYRVLADAKGQARGMVRVIDESGEDYLYPASFLLPIEIPAKATRLFVRAA